MEEDIRYYRTRGPSTTQQIKKKLQQAIDAAEERHAYEAAHDPELLRALGVVESFIRKKRRVCYGGTAMNAILPADKKFYNPEYDLPDYDFYTPDLDDDVRDLVHDLKDAGFREVHHKIGMHDGTKKVLVNFVAVADVSKIETDLFNILQRRAIEKSGIYYTDPDVLRMMMYLELSRPRGQVDRWEKVWERLQLVNQAFPVRHTKATGVIGSIPLNIRRTLLDFIVENRRILCNGVLVGLYKRRIHNKGATFQISEGAPVFALSPTPEKDADMLKQILKGQGSEKATIVVHRALGEIVPERAELFIEKRPVALFLKEAACHSYHPFRLRDGRSICIGSLETLITVSLALRIFTTHGGIYLGAGAMQNVKQYIDLIQTNLKTKRSQLSPFPILCRGHQVGYASLIREKLQRIQAEREQGLGTRSRRAKKNATRKIRKE